MKYEQIKIIEENAQNQSRKFGKSVRYKQSTDKQKRDRKTETRRRLTEKHAARISRGVFVCAQTKVASKQAGKPAERRKEQPGGSADKTREF